MITAALIFLTSVAITLAIFWIASPSFRLSVEVTLRALAAGCRAPARRHGRRVALDYLHTYGHKLAAQVGVTVAIDYDSGRLMVRPGLGGSKR